MVTDKDHASMLKRIYKKLESLKSENTPGIFNTIVTIITTIITIILTLTIYYSTLDNKLVLIDKKLSSLAEQRDGTLTFTQAKALVDLYLSAIRHEFHVEINEFASEKLPRMIERQNAGGAERYINNAAGKVITNARNSVSSFIIGGEQGFKEFLDEVNPLAGEIITKARKGVLDCVLECFGDLGKIDNLYSKMANVVENAGDESRYLFKQELSKRYPRQ